MACQILSICDYGCWPKLCDHKNCQSTNSFVCMVTFIDQCVQDTSSPEAIEDYIDQWHKGESNQSLYAFLGMTFDEYTTWVKNPEILTDILKKRQQISSGKANC